ncbi:hypothetical protein ACFQ0B_16805 [Nonomuraea thailandensis]
MNRLAAIVPMVVLLLGRAARSLSGVLTASRTRLKALLPPPLRAR